MEIIWIIIFIAFVIVTVLVILAAASSSRDRDELARLRANILSEHEVDELFISPHDGNVIGIDVSQRKIVLGNAARRTAYRFDQVFGVEAVENGVTISETNRGSQLKGAAVGALAFGAAGFIVGGLSGSTTSSNNCVELALKIIVDDAANPVHLVDFFFTSAPGGGDSSQGRPKLERMFAFVTNAMKLAKPSGDKGGMVSAADEMQKLWELVKEGALTEEEFSREKNRLLKVTSPSVPSDDDISLLVLTGPGDRDTAVAVALGTITGRNSYDFMDSGLNLQWPTIVLSSSNPSDFAAAIEKIEGVGGRVELRLS